MRKQRRKVKKPYFPSKAEFYEKVMKMKKQREEEKEGIYLGYLQEQKHKRKTKRRKTLKNRPRERE